MSSTLETVASPFAGEERTRIYHFAQGRTHLPIPGKLISRRGAETELFRRRKFWRQESGQLLPLSLSLSRSIMSPQPSS